MGVRWRQTCGAQQAQAQTGRTPPSTPDKSGATSPAEAGEGYIVGDVAVSQGKPKGNLPFYLPLFRGLLCESLEAGFYRLHVAGHPGGQP